MIRLSSDSNITSTVQPTVRTTPSISKIRAIQQPTLEEMGEIKNPKPMENLETLIVHEKCEMSLTILARVIAPNDSHCSRRAKVESQSLHGQETPLVFLMTLASRMRVGTPYTKKGV